MTIFRFFVAMAGAGLALLAYCYSIAGSDPVVRRATVTLPDFPKGLTPITLLLVSDLHVAGPDMPPERLSRIVKQINALSPDVVAIAGDLVSDKAVATRRYPMREAVRPLSALRSRIGTFAVLGNHDHWRDPADARASLRAAGITVLDNDAARAGALVIGGLDDAFTGHDNLGETIRRMHALDGAKVLLSHSPDPFADAPATLGLMLAGHTHCGQIRLPLIGAISNMSDYGGRYACGLVREGRKTLIVTAGIGTSVLPLRLGAVPDMWLVTVKPAP